MHLYGELRWYRGYISALRSEMIRGRFFIFYKLYPSSIKTSNVMYNYDTQKEGKKAMSMNMIRKLPTPKEIKELYPLSDKIVETKKQRDKEIADVFTGKSNKFLLIIGPCSADKEEPVIDYISRLVPVQEQVKDKILIIPRIYTNKPRTTGEGYKGMIHQPDPTKKEDMLEGLIKVRSLHTKAIEQTGFTCADETPSPQTTLFR